MLKRIIGTIVAAVAAEIVLGALLHILGDELAAADIQLSFPANLRHHDRVLPGIEISLDE